MLFLDIAITDHRAIDHYLRIGEISELEAKRLHAKRRALVLAQVADGIEMQKWIANRKHAA